MRTRSARLGWSTLLLAALACDGSSPTTLEPADGMEAGRGGIPKPLGRITVILDAQPNDGRDFGFTLTGQKRAAALDDDADPTLSNTRAWPSLPSGSYTLAFPTPLPAGYRLLPYRCQHAGGFTVTPNIVTATAVIALPEGGDVRCTFVVSVNTTPLTVTINQAGFQDDPTQNPEVYFEVVFSHTPVDFNVNDVAVSGPGSVWSVWPLDNEATRFQVQVGVGADGYISASIPAGAVIDGWGKPNEASTSTDNQVEVYLGDNTECVDDNPDDGAFCTS
jgi:hypothetical protein